MILLQCRQVVMVLTILPRLRQTTVQEALEEQTAGAHSPVTQDRIQVLVVQVVTGIHKLKLVVVRDRPLRLLEVMVQAQVVIATEALTASRAQTEAAVLLVVTVRLLIAVDQVMGAVARPAQEIENYSHLDRCLI